jgi:DMSO/TMAO reductase YedYZ molybdopterin-dependent catalytic subunit
VANVAWQTQPPDEAGEPTDEAPAEDAEVVDLTRQRFLGWVRGMFGGKGTNLPPRDES